jgi:CRISPR type III-A-associated protein Csm2
MPALSVDQVKERIKRLNTMSELEQKDFCEEDGLADSLAQRFGKEALKPTQLYKVFQELKRIERNIKGKEDESFNRNEVIHLLPIMAYNTARGHIPEPFYEIIKECLSSGRLHTNKDFIRVVEFISAVLAYHKYQTQKKGGRQ